MRGWVVLVGVVVTGCRLSADYGGTGYLCEDGVCPAGQSCVAGVCVVGGAPDAPAPDQAAPPDAPSVDGPVDAPPPAPDAPPDAPLPPNLLANGDMELGLDGTWESFGGTLRTSTNTPHGGLQSIVVCKTDNGGLNDLTAYADVINGPTLVMGARYRATIWVRASLMPGELPPPSLFVTLREQHGAAPQLDHDGLPVSPITTTWTQLQVDAIIQEPDRDLLVIIVTAPDVPDGTCFVIDDGVVIEVP